MRNWQILGLITIILSISVVFIIVTFPRSTSINNCLLQDANKKQEELAVMIINEFENFQRSKNLSSLSTCLSNDFRDKRISRENSFPFYTVINYFIRNNPRCFGKNCIVDVEERRLYFVSGISGGSYSDKFVDVQFYLSKQPDGRLLINSYNGWQK